MQINKIGLGIVSTLMTVAGIGTAYTLADRRGSEFFKDRIRVELEHHDGYPSIYTYKKAEAREPFFNKTNYWEVTADSLRRELENAKIKEKETQKRREYLDSTYKERVKEFCESEELKNFLANQPSAKENFLKEHRNHKLVKQGRLYFNENFPATKISLLVSEMETDLSWMPTILDRYEDHKVYKRRLAGRGFVHYTVHKREPIYKPAYKNCVVFFDSEIKNTKYLGYSYYAEDN